MNSRADRREGEPMDKPSSKMVDSKSAIAELAAKEPVTMEDVIAWCADRIAYWAVMLAAEEYNGLPNPPSGESGLRVINEAGLRAVDQLIEDLRRDARAAGPRHCQQALFAGLTSRAGRSKH
jgi:hypothetical protein